jgi:DNA-directed RNA polymerase subunit omega
MARVTVEDCILNIPNRFELVGIAAQRSKQISGGNALTIDRDNDKDGVVALREIADKTVDLDALREEIIEKYSKNQRPDVIDGDSQMANMPTNPRAYIRPAAKDLRESYDEDAEELDDADSLEEMDDEVDGLSFDDENVESDD